MTALQLSQHVPAGKDPHTSSAAGWRGHRSTAPGVGGPRHNAMRVRLPQSPCNAVKMWSRIGIVFPAIAQELHISIQAAACKLCIPWCGGQLACWWQFKTFAGLD